MIKSELLEKLKEFKAKLEEHRELYAKSLNNVIPRYPIKNVRELDMQEQELHRLFAVLEPFIDKYSMRRIKVHRATGSTWEIYREAIGNNVAIIKGSSLDDVIKDLAGIIAKIEYEDKEEIEIIEGKDIKKELEERDRKIKELERRLFEISAHRRLGIVIIIFLIIEYAIINLIMRYGAGLNIFQKLVGSLSLPVAVIVLLRYFGYIIIGKERIKALGWLFTKFFKV